MAIRDAQLQFSAAQALPNNTTAQSTNVIDLALNGATTTSNPHGFNTTDPMILYFLWTGTPVGTSVRIDLRSATTTDLTAATFKTHWSTGIIAAANYATTGLGSGLEPTLVSLPHGTYNPSLSAAAQGTGSYLQYLGLIFITVGDATAGIVTTGLCKAMDMRTYAASGYTVV